MKKRLFYCSQYDNSFARSSPLRHQKRVQCSIGTERTPKHLVTLCLCHQLESAQKWFEDPGDLIYEPDFESGMTIRKKTSPSLPGVKRKAPEQTPDQKKRLPHQV